MQAFRNRYCGESFSSVFYQIVGKIFDLYKALLNQNFQSKSPFTSPLFLAQTVNSQFQLPKNWDMYKFSVIVSRVQGTPIVGDISSQFDWKARSWDQQIKQLYSLPYKEKSLIPFHIDTLKHSKCIYLCRESWQLLEI